MERKRYYLVLLVTCAVYANSLLGGFVYDDVNTVEKNSYITSFKYLGKIFSEPSYWGSNEASRSYRPVFTFCHTVVHAIFSLNPFGYHLFNVLLHLINTALIYRVVLNLTPSGWIAFFTALLFGIHPIHTEAVANITGGAELLSFFLVFMLFAFQARAHTRLVFTAFATMSLFALALLSKENAITYVGVFLVFWILFRKNPEDNPHRDSVPLLLPAAILIITAGAYLLIRKIVFGSLQGIGIPAYYDNLIPHLAPILSSLTALKVLGMYIAKFIFPATLSCDYSYPIITPFAMDLKSLAHLLIFIVFALSPFIFRDKLYRFGVIFFLLTISIVSNLFFPIGTIMGERLLYLPSFGLTLSVVALAAAIERRFTSRPGAKKAAAIIIGCILLALAARTVVRNQDWRNPRALYDNTINNSVPSFRAYVNRANIFIAGKEYERAKNDLDKALLIYPGDCLAYYAYGRLYNGAGKPDSAVLFFSRSLAYAPLFLDAWFERGKTYLDLNQERKAEEDFSQCMKLYDSMGPNGKDIGLAEVYYYIGYAYLMQDKLDSAAYFINESIILHPPVKETVLKDTVFRKLLPELNK